MQWEVSKGFTAQCCRPDSVTISNSSLRLCRRLKYAKAWQEREGGREGGERKRVARGD